ncbi:MAG: class I SAM-dependent methyltransferase [candidate division Zixibacteria bacterium]|nr:class I SAM-dependent methyltransferase [candidate division Zixibacteria bacterium]
MDPLKEWLGRQDGGLVLDVATGRGYSASLLAESLNCYRNIFGIDISMENLCQAQKGIKDKRIILLGMRAESMGFADGTFDTVAVINSLHHLQYVEESLAEMKRVLKPNGNFIIFEMVQDGLNEKQISHREAHHWWGAVDRQNSIFHRETFRNDELRGMVGRLGLSKVEFINFNEETEIDSKEVINNIEKTIDLYIEKIPENIGRQPLIDKGLKLKERFHEVGFAWATILIAIGTK